MTSLRVLRLTGSPFERGTAHGEHFKQEIRDHMRKWKELLEDELKIPVDQYLNRLYRETNFMPAIQQYAPDILEEVRGIAVGSDLPFDWVVARQLSDEEPWYRNTIKYGIDLPQFCTSVGLKGKDAQPNLIAQNMDTPKYYDGSQVLLEIREPDSDLICKVLTITGKLSLCGMNNYGVGITCNTVMQLDFNPAGLPEDFVVRKALQSRSFEEMQAFLLRVPHASGQNYLFGGPDGVLSLECSAHSKIVSMKEAHSDIFYHTNHPICNTDTRIFDIALNNLKQHDPEFYASLLVRLRRDTYKRYEVVSGLMEDLENISPEALMAVLRDRTSPLSIDLADEFSNFTLSSIIMVLDRENPVLYATNGPPHTSGYESFNFDL